MKIFNKFFKKKEAKTPSKPIPTKILPEPIASSLPEENSKHSVLLKKILSHADICSYEDQIWGIPSGLFKFELENWLTIEERDDLLKIKKETEEWQDKNSTEKFI